MVRAVYQSIITGTSRKTERSLGCPIVDKKTLVLWQRAASQRPTQRCKAHLWLLSNVTVINRRDDKLPWKRVNWHIVLSCACLQHSSQETGREGESRHPEYDWLMCCSGPLCKLLNAQYEITCPVTKRLIGRVSLKNIISIIIWMLQKAIMTIQTESKIGKWQWQWYAFCENAQNLHTMITAKVTVVMFPGKANMPKIACVHKNMHKVSPLQEENEKATKILRLDNFLDCNSTEAYKVTSTRKPATSHWLC